MKRTTKISIISASEVICKQIGINVGTLRVSTAKSQKNGKHQYICHHINAPIFLDAIGIHIKDFWIAFTGGNEIQNQAICILTLYQAHLIGPRVLKDMQKQTNNPFLTGEYIEKLISRNVACVPL